jgi:hypothetical protein
MGQAVELMGGITRTFFPPFTIKSLTGQAIESVWVSVIPWIQAALDYSRGELSLEYVRACLHAEQMQLWVAYEEGKILGVMVTQLLQHSHKKTCNVVAIDGKNITRIWREGAQYMITWLLANDVDELEATCRDSVAAMLSGMNFERTANVMTYSLRRRPE